MNNKLTRKVNNNFIFDHHKKLVHYDLHFLYLYTHLLPF